MRRFLTGALIGAVVAAIVAGSVYSATSLLYINGPLTSGHVLVATTDGFGAQDGGAAVALGSANTWTAANTFAEVHGAVNARGLTTNVYTAVTADCGTTVVLPTGTTPSVTLPNLNTPCTITFILSTAVAYTFNAASGGSTNNTSAFHVSKATIGTMVGATIMTPSATAAVWTLSGDLAS
jgi:hypothetical protein